MSFGPFRNIWEPAELVRFLVTTNILLFLTALLLAPQAVNLSLSPLSFLAPATPVLYKLGTTGSFPVLLENRWWTLITANYLHGSLLHLLFNVAALNSLGKLCMPVFGPSRLFLIYSLGGVAGMAASSMAGITLTLGASAAICALIGALAYDDWRAHKGNLKQRIVSVGTWIALIALTGLLMPAINNLAHGVGFVSGFILGFCFWPRVTLPENTLFRISATAVMLLTIGLLIYGLLFS